MSDNLEFHDFSFGSLFGRKKGKDNQSTKGPRINLHPTEDKLLPPVTGEDDQEEYAYKKKRTNFKTQSGAYTDLNFPLIRFSEHPADTWTLSDAVRGVQVFGGIGSGKSSGSGKLFALTFLKNGFGGLVLCGKPDERENWEKYASLTGRTQDLIIFDKASGYEFNPLIYELTRQSEGAGETNNIVNLFMSIYKLGARINGSEAKSTERFWENALRRLLIRTIDLLKLSGEELSIANIVDVITTAPDGADFLEYTNELKQEEETTGQDNLIENWYLSNYCTACLWSASDMLDDENEEAALEKEVLFNALQRYFLKELATLAPETRSSLLETLYGITEPFNSGILSRQFSRGLSEDVKPEITFDSDDGRGKIIIIDYPVKNYLEAGIYAQGIYKLLWQQAVERRRIRANEAAVPVFLWADESQFFVSEYDMLFQTTARSSRACTVFLTQNISNYYAMMGGDNSRARVDSLLGNLSTKIFHANNDFETNQWAANTIGKQFVKIDASSTSFNPQSLINLGFSEANQLHYQVEPKEFTVLKSGGAENEFKVEGYIITAGKKWYDEESKSLKNYKYLSIYQLSNIV